jgi:hypothetical protein
MSDPEPPSRSRSDKTAPFTVNGRSMSDPE